MNESGESKRPSEFLLLKEVAAICRAPLGSVRYWVATGKLTSIRPKHTRRRLVPRAALERFLTSGVEPK